MAENMAKCIKLWQAFVKFVKNQVQVNGRLVDTQLIGLFGKSQPEGDIFFMPSPDYLEAGKFKVQRGPGSLFEKLGLTETGNDYNAKYQEKLQVSSHCISRYKYGLTSILFHHHADHI